LVQEIRLTNRSLTLRRRHDVHFKSATEEQRADTSRRAFLADSFIWMRDQTLMSKLKELLSIEEGDPSNVQWKVRRALETGEVVTIPDPVSSGSHRSSGDDKPWARALTFTPSQLFKRAASVASASSYYDRPVRPRLSAEDDMLAWSANPGDVLPDGRIVTAISRLSDDGGSDASLLGDAQPFEYVPDELRDETEELAGTTNERYAAKMLGYDRSTFREMIHRFKRANGVGPNDDLEFEENGDVSFNGEYIDNFHDYGN
jgi:hypothetical protein